MIFYTSPEDRVHNAIDAGILGNESAAYIDFDSYTEYSDARSELEHMADTVDEDSSYRLTCSGKAGDGTPWTASVYYAS